MNARKPDYEKIERLEGELGWAPPRWHTNPMSTAADLPDVRCASCGHPRGADCGCSCTGRGTCGGGTDDIL